jgi:hypothetical protein
MGDISMNKALRDKLIRLSGLSELKKDIASWLGRNYYADVKPARRA